MSEKLFGLDLGLVKMTLRGVGGAIDLWSTMMSHKHGGSETT